MRPSDPLQARLIELCTPDIEYATLLIERTQSESLRLKQGRLDPPSLSDDSGLQVTVHREGGVGYAATSNLSPDGVSWAFAEASRWARVTARRAISQGQGEALPHTRGDYFSPVRNSWWDLSFDEKLDRLRQADAQVSSIEGIVFREFSTLAKKCSRSWFSHLGGEVHQQTEVLSPDLSLVASRDGVTQRRSFGLRGRSAQGGVEIFEAAALAEAGPRLAEEALLLLSAPKCPSGEMDLIIDAEQMMLQVHESIGHPLELDRILGDERNYAGRSFVTSEMFGHFMYGSPALNVTFDPTVSGELASYAVDDQGSEAKREYLIKEGRLLRPLGGALSQRRAGLPGVSCARTQRWNRPPIDRMANLNVEPGERPLADLISQVERGVFMGTNMAWSIDDSRNKFQFGCEYGRIIEDGVLGGWVRTPNYRGVSSSFWRALEALGDESTFEVLGTPYCGKGEPNQIITVGHAVPAGLFRNISVFGGA